MTSTQHIIILSTVLVASAVGCSRYSGPCTGESCCDWKKMEIPYSKPLFDIWGSSEEIIYVVGNEGTILKYNGSSWSRMNIEGVNESDLILLSVWGSSESNVLAAGTLVDHQNMNDHSVILQYDGIRWSVVFEGNAPAISCLWGTSGDNVFAGGSGGVILHYDGITWSELDSKTNSHLHGIWGSAKNSVYAVGGRLVDSETVGDILHYDESSWATIYNAQYSIYDIWGISEDHVYSVGMYGAVLRQDAGEWVELLGGEEYSLYGIWGSSNSDIIAVGGSMDIDNGTCYGVVMHYDGQGWEKSYETNYELFSAWGASETELFVVGGDIHDGVVIRRRCL